MTHWLTAREIQARLGLSDGAVRSMIRLARGAIRVQDTTPKLICWEDVQAWRNDAPQRKAAVPWHIESRVHFEGRMARKDGERMTATHEGTGR